MQRFFIVVSIILCLNINSYAIAGNGHRSLVGTMTFSSQFDSTNHFMRYTGPNKEDFIVIECSILSPQYTKLENRGERLHWIASSCQTEEKEKEPLNDKNSDQSPEISNNKQIVKECPDTRPQVCTQDYRPVCAELENGDMKTYSNGCNACTDLAVIGYREGTCE